MTNKHPSTRLFLLASAFTALSCIYLQEVVTLQGPDLAAMTLSSVARMGRVVPKAPVTNKGTLTPAQRRKLRVIDRRKDEPVQTPTRSTRRRSTGSVIQPLGTTPTKPAAPIKAGCGDGLRTGT